MKFFTLGVVVPALTIALLSACGGAASSVTLKDPLGLGNGARTVEIDLSHNNDVVVQNFGSNVAGSMPTLLGSFEDIQEKIPFTAKQMSISQGWAGTVTLKSAPNVVLPDALTLKNMQLKINVYDAATTATLGLVAANDARAVCGQEQVVDNVKSRTCTFSNANGKLITILDAATAATFLKVISEGGTNTLEATFSVQIDELPAGQGVKLNMPFGEGSAVVMQ